MAKGTVSIVAIIAGLALAGALGVTVGGSDGSGGGFIGHLNKLGHHLHGGDHHHDQMTQLIEQLALTPDQHRHLEKVHEIIGNHGRGEPGPMVELHEQLMAQFQEGQIENEEIRRTIDDHVEQIRQMAYDVTDELVALVNGLDAAQRETLMAHLQGTQDSSHGDAHGH